MRVTSKQVTAALKAAGYNAELVKGQDYWYFSGPDADDFKEQGVSVPRISDLTVEEWVSTFKQKWQDRNVR